MNIINKSLVEQVKWADDPNTYDIRLHALGKDYDNFIIINPAFDSWVLENFDSSPSLNKCIMWVRGDKWLAKKFNKDWTPEQGWEIQEVKIDSVKKDYIIVERNPDLPDLFSVPDHKISLNCLDYEYIWYLDRKFFPADDVWVFKMRACERPFKTEKMGSILPNIIDELDVVFISYDEDNADANWQKVLNVAPYAQRVHGVKGIFEAHKAAAELSQTDMFWVVDGDAEILPSWNFNFQPNIFNRDCVHVWSSINPINNLEYGYGGLKLFPKKLVDSASTWKVDMTTSLGNKLKVMNTVSNVTAFNTSPFATWRSAFRECAKLAAGVINNQNSSETEERLRTWISVGKEKLFGNYAIAGAIAGAAYGQQNFNSFDKLKLINNREWLFEAFKNEKI
jgi:hypothetical protein